MNDGFFRPGAVGAADSVRGRRRRRQRDEGRGQPLMLQRAEGCLNIDPAPFGDEGNWAGAIVNAIPGIIVQIILIPMVVIVLEKANLISNKK